MNLIPLTSQPIRILIMYAGGLILAASIDRAHGGDLTALQILPIAVLGASVGGMISTEYDVWRIRRTADAQIKNLDAKIDRVRARIESARRSVEQIEEEDPDPSYRYFTLDPEGREIEISIEQYESERRQRSDQRSDDRTGE